ncbi:uncharacterized protein LOC117326543 [Pecten maximus]|uniref:uncharacterized protein LOC117326543 n=1 Tax=Pecten maximus TaxID=6579 RepID=UPI00145812C4|nr:uncharacterized protein LOC117326543 [Pecten maximus]
MAPKKIALLWGLFLFLFCVQLLRSEENIAYGRMASQSSTYGRWPADKGVDGCLEQLMQSDCCSHTAGNEINAWWQVDLGHRSTVSYITIYYRAASQIAQQAT